MKYKAYFLGLIFAMNIVAQDPLEGDCPEVTTAEIIKIAAKAGAVTGVMSGVCDGIFLFLGPVFSWPTAVNARQAMIADMVEEIRQGRVITYRKHTLAGNVGDLTAWATWAATTGLVGTAVVLIGKTIYDKSVQNKKN